MRSDPRFKILSLTLAMLVFFSSTGFSVQLHYCQGQLKSFDWYGGIKTIPSNPETDAFSSCNGSCSISKPIQKKVCQACKPNDSENVVFKKDCCSNKTLKFKANDDAKAFEHLVRSIKHKNALALNIQSNTIPKSGRSKEIVPYLNYSPPLLNKDIPVLIQCFLL